MPCSTDSTPKSAKSTNESSSIFSAWSKTVLSNLRQIDPTWTSNELIFFSFVTAFWLLHIHNNNIFTFQPYFGQIWSVVNNNQLFYWTCAKFPAQGVRPLRPVSLRTLSHLELSFLIIRPFRLQTSPPLGGLSDKWTEKGANKSPPCSKGLGPFWAVALLDCFPSLKFTFMHSRETGIVDHILPLGDQLELMYLLPLKNSGSSANNSNINVYNNKYMNNKVEIKSKSRSLSMNNEIDIEDKSSLLSHSRCRLDLDIWGNS